MILYILYNANLFEIIGDKDYEDSLGFVEDIALVSLGDSFEETIGRLENLMEKEGGGNDWSEDHNSKFEMSKSVVMHLSRRTRPDPDVQGKRIQLARRQMVIRGKQIKEVVTFKYLGAIVDNQLRWTE